MKNTPLVTIRCTVYNHEPFLRQCLDGFVMQQTTFPFEAIVHDDASTDGSAAIIREYAEKYPDIIKPIYETENQYSKGALPRRITEAMHPDSKYVAICEGDDYWIDPLKLQKQVDILEADETIGLVHSAAKVFDQQKGEYKDKLWGMPIDSFEEELITNRPVTLTACYRKELLAEYRKFFSYRLPNNWKMGDYPLWLFISYHSKTHFIDEPTGVYRLLKNSASHNPDPQKMADFELSAYDVRFFFAKEFHHEHMLKQLATNLVGAMHGLSIKNDQKIEFDFEGIKRSYGLKNPVKLQIRNYILQHDFLRHQYVKYLRFRTGDVQ